MTSQRVESTGGSGANGLIRNRTETLATRSRNRVLVCSGIIGRPDRAKIKQNKQTNKKRWQGQRGH